MDNTKPEPLDLHSSNLSEAWRRWSQTMNLCLDGPLSGKSDKAKCSYFLLYIGQDARDVFNTWTLSEEEQNKPKILFEKFGDYCKPKKNPTVLRHKFNSRVQSTAESADHFITDLKLLSLDCEYGPLRDEMIRDRLVVGVHSEEMKEKLLQESDLTLDTAVKIVKAIEGSKQHVKSIESDHTVHALRSTSRKMKQPQKQANSRSKCGKCGNHHSKGQCPAYGKKCLKCHKRNHFAAVCKSQKSVHLMHNDDSDQSDTESPDHFIGGVNSNQSSNEAFVKLLLGKEKTALQFKLDTGAQVNVIPLQKFKQMKLKDIKLEHTNTKLTGYGGTKLKVKGKCSLQCCYKNSEIVGTFHVVDTNSPAVLGLQSCVDLGLIKLVMSVSSNNSMEEMLNKYKSVFQGLGCLKEPYHIKIDRSVSPVIHPPRRIPTALRGKLKATLDEMEKLGVIRKVDEPTDWVSSMVVVEKPKSNKLRVS